MVEPRWHEEVVKKLSQAGWFPSRNVWPQLQLPPSFKIHSVAKGILSEFGNLEFGDQFDTTRFDPVAGEEVSTEIRKFEIITGRWLYPLGYLQVQDRMYLLVAEDGIIYRLLGYGRDASLNPAASSFEKVLDYLVRGSDKQDVMKADLEPLGLFGKEWRLDEG